MGSGRRHRLQEALDLAGQLVLHRVDRPGGVQHAAGGGAREAVRFGHPSGTLRVGAQAKLENGEWKVTKAIMSRSARVIMEGFVRVPGDCF